MPILPTVQRDKFLTKNFTRINAYYHTILTNKLSNDAVTINHPFDFWMSHVWQWQSPRSRYNSSTLCMQWFVVWGTLHYCTVYNGVACVATNQWSLKEKRSLVTTSVPSSAKYLYLNTTNMISDATCGNTKLEASKRTPVWDKAKKNECVRNEVKYE